MKGTDRITVGRPLPTILKVRPAEGFEVVVTWESGLRKGRTDVIDIAPHILIYKIYRPLRTDRALFETVHVCAMGIAIGWGPDDDNEQIDMAATTLERFAEDGMTNVDFAQFLERKGLSLDAAAAYLGISRRLVAYYAKDRRLPRHIALACRYLDSRLRDRAPAA